MRLQLRSELHLAAGLCAFLLLASGCKKRPTEPGANGARVLFVGNSLTYYNDLPNLVRAVALLMDDTITVHMEAVGGTALIDHLNGASQAVEALNGNHWSTVVLQQGPTPRGVCRDSLVLWTTMFEPLIRKSGARTALMMTWPANNARSDLFDEVRESFQQAAVAVNGVFLPAGEAWRIAWSMDATLPLYGEDGFHPSPLGSLLAAIEIHGRLSGRDLRTLPVAKLATIAPPGTSAETLQLLIDAAHTANLVFPAQPGPENPAAAARVSGTAMQTC